MPRSGDIYILVLDVKYVVYFSYDWKYWWSQIIQNHRGSHLFKQKNFQIEQKYRKNWYIYNRPKNLVIFLNAHETYPFM